MTTKAVKEKRVNAARKRIEELKAKLTKLDEEQAKTDIKLKTEQEKLAWLEQMPVDDDEDEVADPESVDDEGVEVHYDIEPGDSAHP